MGNGGVRGWTGDRGGYRDARDEPGSGLPGPAMPAAFARLATVAADEAGFDGVAPDACLVNRHVPGMRLSLHQDRAERDFDAPLVSAWLRLPAAFLFGGTARADQNSDERRVGKAGSRR